MRSSDLAPLLEVVDAQYDAAQGKMAKINAREQAMRTQIADLDAQFADSAMTDPNALHRMHRLGAQELWAGWTARKRSELNMSLALVLADKMDHLGVLRKASGRRDALHELWAEAIKKERQKHAVQENEKILALAILEDRRSPFE